MSSEIKTWRERGNWPSNFVPQYDGMPAWEAALSEIAELRAKVESLAADASAAEYEANMALSCRSPWGMSEQALCDLVREKSLLSDKGMTWLLNGDFVALNVTAITAIVNAALAAPESGSVSSSTKRCYLGKVHAKTEVFHFTGSDVRLQIIDEFGMYEMRVHGDTGRFVVEAVATANRLAMAKEKA